MPPERSPETDDRSRQKRVGAALREDTRQRLLDAATVEFEARGYAATTVTRLAATAGVSVQTLYLAWGSKRALLRGYMEKALAGPASSPEKAAERFTSDMTPRQRVEELATLVTEIAERASTGWKLYSDASAIDPEIAADWDDLQHRRHQLFGRIIGDAFPHDAFALTPGNAVDTAWAIASPETFDLLVRRLDYTLDEFHAWLSRILTAALLRST